ncbi:LamG-like jellyroll fold domain-containing protein [Tichowtungia aerotolerans]|uniref:LamG-like jellyroll fold domain-containing protein n=1 Tax=Tichowtungia aerotolerans TaxID=2697043 RepID=A0A6P1ME22_9BACT|nr:LamG-like jellyroll fold domain-containing protein [Tichowtungia aerotolerans]QHI69846.1 hypothetical protein GT409_10415 [Tichowtungia aerotolerans]
MKMLKLAILLAVEASLGQADTIDFTEGGTQTNGFYYWGDTSNWVGGSLPDGGDLARYNSLDMGAFLDNDQTIASLSIQKAGSGLTGTNTLTLASYLIMGADDSLTLSGSVRVDVNNYTKITGSSAVTLNDNSFIDLDNVYSDDAANVFMFTLNSNSTATVLNAHGSSLGFASGSCFVLNGSSALASTSLTVEEWYAGYLTNGIVLKLNDTASIQFQTSGNNASDIIAHNAGGYLLINGSSNAVEGVDYTYDPGTGVLQAMLEPPVISESQAPLFYLDSRRPGPRPIYNTDTNSPLPTWEGLMTGAYFPVRGVNITDPADYPLWVTADAYGSMAYHQFTFESDTHGGRIAMPDVSYGNTGFDYDDDFSIEVWVCPERSPALADGRMHLFGNQTVDGQGYRLTAKEETGGLYSIEFEMQDVSGETTRYGCSTSADFQMGEWIQVVGVYDGNSGAVPSMKIYVNGVDQQAEWDGDLTVPADSNFIPDFLLTTMGARGKSDAPTLDSDRHYFEGKLSVMRLYTNVLSAADVEKNYNGERARFKGELFNWLPKPDFHTNAVPHYKTWTNGTHRSQMMRLPSDRRVTIAAEDGHYLCRVDVAQTKSGRLICAFLDNSDHTGRGDPGDFSHVGVSVSDDNGATWHDPNDPAESYGLVRSGWWDTDGYGHKVVNISYHPELGSNGVTVINTGRVYNEAIHPDAEAHHILFWSIDDGLTWSTQSLTNIPTSNVSPDRIRVLDNGDWVILGHATRRPTVWYSQPRGEETLIRSKDQGQTWLPVSELVQSQDHKSWHESSLLDTGGGNLVVYMDDMTWQSYPTFRCYSRDYGHNFSPPVMAPWFGQKNESGLLNSGKVFTLFRTHGTEEGYTAHLGDPFETNNIMPVTSFCYDQNRIRLYPDRLTLDSGEGNFQATMYTLPPTVDPSDRVTFKARLRCLSGDVNACHIDVGLPVMIRTNRVELLDDPAIGFDVDATQWIDLEIDRDGGSLLITCDETLMVDTNVSAYIQNSGLNGDSAGRTIKFGNYCDNFSHENFSRNNGLSEWQSVEVTLASEFFPSWHWTWAVEDWVYPDQYKRDRLIMLEPEGADWSTDYGYGGWVQLHDGSIYAVDYTLGEEGTVGDRGSLGADPFIRGYRLYESDFDFAPVVDATLELNAAFPGNDPDNVWEPIVGSGGTLLTAGGSEWLPQPDQDGNIPCYQFDCTNGLGGQAAAYSASGLSFDYDDDFSVEVWFKPEKSVAASGRMHLIGNQLAGEAGSACGWRLTARQISGTDRFFMELTLRDNLGTDRVTYQVRTSETWPMDRWTHVLAVYDGVPGAVPMMQIYVNGEYAPLVMQSGTLVPPAEDRDFVVPNQELSVGARGRLAVSADDDNRQWFGGYISMIRVYAGALNNTQSNRTVNEDADNDGYTVWQEYMTNTDPSDPQSRFTFGVSSGNAVSFDSSAQSLYTLEYADSLISNVWKAVGLPVSGTGGQLFINVTNNTPQRFYRLKAEPLP